MYHGVLPDPVLRIGSALLLVLLVFSSMLSCEVAGDEKRPHVVFVVGDDEYRSEISMPMIAKILEAKHQMKCSIASAKPGPRTKDNLVGLKALSDADLAVLFVRFRKLPDGQLKMLMDYVDSGRPLVGLRTTTHAFLYPADHKHADLNDGFGRKVFGQKWITHHGHASSTDVSIIPGRKQHPILRGVAPKFHCRSWLYHVTPLVGDCQPLLVGQSVDSNKKDQAGRYPQSNPVAWTKTYKDARVFFTTLGHPQDFQEESMRRLLINGIYWALGKQVPQGGANAEIQGKYVAPPTF